MGCGFTDQGGGCCSNTYGLTARGREKEVWDTVGSHACEDKVSEILGEVRWLVCPLVLVWCRVEKVNVCVDKQEHSTVVSIALYESFDWVEMSCPCRVCMVCQGSLDWAEVFLFVR